MEYKLTDQELAELTARGGNITEAQQAKRKAWLEANPKREMEYTNYETGKPCSRTEYIEDGLERGELLYRYDCGCVIIQDRTADAYIVYCPKHGAAPELYEALKEVYSNWGTRDLSNDTKLERQLLKALSKAEVK